MSKRKRLAAALLALPALAQQPRHAFEAQASLVSVAPETRRLVDDNAVGPTIGTSLGLAYRGRLQSTALEHRVHVDLLGLKAKAETGMAGAAPKHLEFGWDLIFRRGTWSFYSGFLGMRWKQTIDDQTANGFRDYPVGGTTKLLNSPKGTKLGGRIGVERPLGGDFSLFASYTQTEFNKQQNPGWFSFGVVYRGWQR